MGQSYWYILFYKTTMKKVEVEALVVKKSSGIAGVMLTLLRHGATTLRPNCIYNHYIACLYSLLCSLLTTYEFVAFFIHNNPTSSFIVMFQWSLYVNLYGWCISILNALAYIMGLPSLPYKCKLKKYALWKMKLKNYHYSLENKTFTARLIYNLHYLPTANEMSFFRQFDRYVPIKKNNSYSNEVCGHISFQTIVQLEEELLDLLQIFAVTSYIDCHLACTEIYRM